MQISMRQAVVCTVGTTVGACLVGASFSTAIADLVCESRVGRVLEIEPTHVCWFLEHTANEFTLFEERTARFASRREREGAYPTGTDPAHELAARWGEAAALAQKLSTQVDPAARCLDHSVKSQLSAQIYLVAFAKNTDDRALAEAQLRGMLRTFGYSPMLAADQSTLKAQGAPRENQSAALKSDYPAHCACGYGTE